MSSKDAKSSNVKILGGAVVCNECELRGDITIGARTVVHPKARIIAESGPIIIGEFRQNIIVAVDLGWISMSHILLGEGNLIEEQTEIVNKCEAPEAGGGGESGAVPVMIIGNNNVFEVSSSNKDSII